MKNPLGIRSFWLLLLTTFIFGCGNKEETKGSLEIVTTDIQPDAYFHESVNAFVAKNYKESSEAILKGINAMELIASAIDEPQKTKIKNSIGELSDLRTNVAADKVDGLEELNYFFARAGQALAGLHMHVSEVEYHNLNGKNAGAELRKAIAEIEGTVEFHDRKFDAEELTLIDQIKSQAKSLEKGENVPAAEVEASLKSLGRHLEKWSNEIEVTYNNYKSKKEIILHNKI